MGLFNVVLSATGPDENMDEFIITDDPMEEAVTAEEANRWEKTVQTCEIFLETDPHSLPTRHLLAQAHLNLNAPESAALSLKALLMQKDILRNTVNFGRSIYPLGSISGNSRSIGCRFGIGS